MLFNRAISGGYKMFCPDIFNFPVYTEADVIIDEKPTTSIANYLTDNNVEVAQIEEPAKPEPKPDITEPKPVVEDKIDLNQGLIDVKNRIINNIDIEDCVITNGLHAELDEALKILTDFNQEYQDTLLNFLVDGKIKTGKQAKGILTWIDMQTSDTGDMRASDSALTDYYYIMNELTKV
jgi:hypothetical protein